MFPTAMAAGYDYQLSPQKIATDTYVLQGSQQHFRINNGGNIQNVAFVVTGAGVIVWDTGPSMLYGEQFRAAIATVTDQPIAKVFISHHHPDHVFGNQAFAGDIEIYALPATNKAFHQEADGLSQNLYRLVGNAMSGTEPVPPTGRAEAGSFSLGGHEFVLHALSGHTAGDLSLQDVTTGVIFAGDLVFNGRAATTPHADIGQWMQSLDYLDALEFDLLVPGHGSVDDGRKAIFDTRDYLSWLVATLQQRAREGADMAEVLTVKRPARFQALSEGKNEFQRSVAHLFPRYEEALFESGAATTTHD
ncbi:MAG: quinoprotein relay system zinc metallohydrolase 1 [Proteobacteria bacterium]|nr:quinoprotein relay system zinc metallohydrolase 1 [Pseudomonadota bacterium]